jgi:hypothetical protein
MSPAFVTDNGEAMRSGRRSRLAEAYVVACLLLALLVFVPSRSSYLPFFLLFLVTLPVSLSAYFVTYAGGVILVGPGNWGAPGAAYAVIVWATFIALQAFAFRALCHARRSHAAVGNL